MLSIHLDIEASWVLRRVGAFAATCFNHPEIQSNLFDQDASKHIEIDKVRRGLGHSGRIRSTSSQAIFSNVSSDEQDVLQ